MMTVKIKGNKELIRNFEKAPKFLQDRMKLAMGKTLAMAEGESKRRTPVDTGLLRSSIGGAQGFKEIRPFRSEVGTNVKYAVYVHEGKARHTVGERKYMERGLKAAEPYIEDTTTKALEELAEDLATDLK